MDYEEFKYYEETAALDEVSNKRCQDNEEDSGEIIFKTIQFPYREKHIFDKLVTNFLMDGFTLVGLESNDGYFTAFVIKGPVKEAE